MEEKKRMNESKGGETLQMGLSKLDFAYCRLSAQRSRWWPARWHSTDGMAVLREIACHVESC